MKDIFVKLFEVLKNFKSGVVKFEQGAQVFLTDAAAKYAVLSGKIQEVEAAAPAVIAQAQALESNVIVVAAVVSNVVTEAQTVAEGVQKAVETVTAKKDDSSKPK